MNLFKLKAGTARTKTDCKAWNASVVFPKEHYLSKSSQDLANNARIA